MLMLVPFLAPVALAQPTSISGSGGWASIEEIQKSPSKYPVEVRQMATRANGGVTASSASGCNRSVCIEVVGRSTNVSAWRSQAYGNQGCIKGNFQSTRGTYQTPTICPHSLDDGIYFWNKGPTGYFRANTFLCNTWNRIAGRPCIEIRR